MGCDQATKQLAIDRLEGAPPISLAGDAIRLELAGEHRRVPEPRRAPSRRRWQRARLRRVRPRVPAAWSARSSCARGTVSASALAALGLVVGGGLGNWLDRVRGAGAVTDFVSLGVGGLRTGIFNVADVAIVAGVVLLALVRSAGGSDGRRARWTRAPSRSPRSRARSRTRPASSPDWRHPWGAGIVFGLLVLAPTRASARFLALSALSIAVYRVAVWLAQSLVRAIFWPCARTEFRHDSCNTAPR